LGNAHKEPIKKIELDPFYLFGKVGTWDFKMGEAGKFFSIWVIFKGKNDF
jgi:hypothetical protein